MGVFSLHTVNDGIATPNFSFKLVEEAYEL